MKKVKNLPQHLDEIVVSQLVFDHSEWISLWGSMVHEGQESRMDFIVTFDTFNKLLRLSGEKGDAVQMLLVDQLEKGVEEPTVIDLEEKMGRPQHFAQCRIEVSKTGLQDEEGKWRDDPNCLSIDEVHPRLETKKPVLTSRALCKQNLSKCVSVLAGSYALYLGYRELGFDEEASLQKAELQDDLKFKMAYYAWSANKEEE